MITSAPNSRRGIAAILALCLAGTAALPALAQGAPGAQVHCAPGSKDPHCQAPNAAAKGGQQPKEQRPQQRDDRKAEAHGEQHAQAQPQGRGHDQRPPQIGDNGRGGQPLKQAKSSRLPAPPAHQHYRVIDDRVVRVDDDTMKIIAVVGLASALLNQ